MTVCIKCIKQFNIHNVHNCFAHPTKEVVMVNLTQRYYVHWIIICLLMTDLTVAVHQNNCPLWHTYSKDRKSCKCCPLTDGLMKCEKEYVNVAYSHCLTWNNATYNVQISRCLYIHQDRNICDSYYWYNVSSKITGLELNNVTCKPYNRQGVQCQHCIDDYGPAAFSDGVTCADCSKYKHFWILNLLFQMMMVTLLYLLVILFQVKGTCSPFNVIITNCQLGINAIMIGAGLHTKIICITNQRFAITALTLIGVLNLDFFRFLIPPLCISSSLKFVQALLFDYIIAVYPIILTIIIYVAIELYDRNWRIIVYLGTPFRLLWCRNWRPKETILSTCATFLLLSYSKFLFVSINLLFHIRAYNCNGKETPNTPVLLYDPSIKYLHSEHIPYAILALSVITVFVLLPPLLLLLYPTRLFRKCLNCCGFRRWDILHLVMDIFQGWYKNGTEGTYDYRPFSALYMIMRIVLSCAYLKLLVFNYVEYPLFDVSVGLLYVFLGMMFHAFKPYKVNWMNHTDGAICLLMAFLLLTYILKIKIIYYIGIACGMSVTLVVSLCLGYKCLRKITS